MKNWKFGVRYINGKVMLFRTLKSNPGVQVPDWAVDIREILIIGILGICAVCLIAKDYIHEALYILLPLVGYVVGRTVPYPTKSVLKKEA